MKTFRCTNCKHKFKYGWWNIERYWNPTEKGYECIHTLICPKCKNKHRISFWKTPFRSKLQFIREWLGSF